MFAQQSYRGGVKQSKDGLLPSFTEELAYESLRYEARTVPLLLTQSATVDRLQGLLSVSTFSLGIVVFVLVVLPAVLSSLLFDKLAQRRSSTEDGSTTKNRRSANSNNNNNRSVTQGSRTALFALWARSQMNRLNIGGPDSVAPSLMDNTSVFGGDNDRWSIFLSRLCGALARTHFTLTGRLFEDQIFELIPPAKTGPIAYLQARTCWLDDCVEEFSRRLSPPLHTKSKSTNDDCGCRANVVILGSGFDSRSYRMKILKEAGIQVYEVDAPGTQARKREALKKAAIDTNGTVYVSCNFEKEDWLVRLKEHGDLDCSLPTMFLWEGVTMYLSIEAIVHTLKKVSNNFVTGSCIGFDYLDNTMSSSSFLMGLMKSLEEPIQCTMDSSEWEELLRSVSLIPLDHLRYKELIRRYLPKHYDGRPIGYLDDCGGFLLAGVSSKGDKS